MVGEFRSWLNTILKRAIADYWRRRERTIETQPLDHADVDDRVGPEPSVTDGTGYVETQMLIEACLGELNDEHQRVVEIVSSSAGRRTTPWARSRGCRATTRTRSSAGSASVCARCSNRRIRNDKRRRRPPAAVHRAVRKRGSGAPRRCPRAGAGTDRRELESLIDAYLERAPRRAFSAEAFEASPARPLVDDLAQSLEGMAGTWPVVLPRLRARARLRRAELVTQLAQALGVSDREAKAAGYYHAIEQGELDPAGVSDRVLDALARLTGTTAKALRDPATALQPGAGPAAAAPTFARAATPEPEHLASLVSADVDPSEEGSDRDLVDELFTGGDVR